MSIRSDLNMFHANRCKLVSIWRTGRESWTIAHCHDDPSQGFRHASFQRYRDALEHAKQYGVDVWKENRADYTRIVTVN